MRRGTFDADFHHYRLEFPSHHGVVRRPSFCRQLYNGHRYPLDGSYHRRDRLLFRRKIVHRLSFLATLPSLRLYLLGKLTPPSAE